MSDSVLPHRRQPTRLHHPWNSPGKNTGVVCHFLLQCVKVKSERKSLSHVQLFKTPWTAAYQAPPSMGFSRQQYWSGVPLPSPQGHKESGMIKAIEHAHACTETCCLPKKDIFQNITAHCQCTGHSIALMKICHEISVVFMPSNTTSILHPMNHRIISEFKFCYLRHVFHKALTAIDGDLSMDLGKVKLKTFWKGFTILDAIKNICDLWEEVKISIPKGIWEKLIPIPHYPPHPCHG